MGGWFIRPHVSMLKECAVPTWLISRGDSVGIDRVGIRYASDTLPAFLGTVECREVECPRGSGIGDAGVRDCR